ncbi:hypothetical protein [Antarcticimicrobium sediminis]|uniref:Uncharacterized protein n=1 Tax=Antarcticimicrobium sediminis TaxID=2546227 RepID=A0A4R5F0F7_9RHOB|nr:hypothetical protein [Antarcticimicrobium sediminis]TDE40948.1 hypothetical protein E1B25_01675 [Antarcticimicrobium sediminis]
MIQIDDARSRPVGIERLLERDDRPVSGGVSAVLGRGGQMIWSEAADAALLDARLDDLPAIARSLGIALSTAQIRKDRIERRIMGMMA